MPRTAERTRGNLPGSVTRFVGRRRKIADIRALLGQERLIILTGIGGAGKTRLALEVAGRSWRSFPGGLWLIDLSVVTGESAVQQTVVRTLGIVDRGPGLVTDKIAAYFGDARSLLVLDNCEHLADACAEFAGRLLARTSEITIFTTSRQALGIPGEQMLELLDRLVAQSIVLTESAGDHVRFRLLDTVRQYGQEKLAGRGEEPELRRRYRDYYLALAERLAASWCGPDQAEIHETIRAACRRGRAREAARLLAIAESAWALGDNTITAFGAGFAAHREECQARIKLALGERALPAARERYRYEDLSEAIAAALGEPAPAEPGGSAIAGDPLTKRERQIAGLVAEGLSNRAVAERLVISPRTVDGHMERILAKLGFSSRAQVAAWAAGGGRLAPPPVSSAARP